MHAVKAPTSDWTTSGADVAIETGTDATASAVACPDVADHAHWYERRPLRCARHGLVTRCRGVLESTA